MLINEIFSERQKRIRGEVPDVYQYETIPRELRVQAIHILNRIFGQLYPYVVKSDDFEFEYIEFGHHQFDEYMELEKEFTEWQKFNLRSNYEQVHELLCQEYGVFTLGNSNDPCESVRSFLIETEETEKAIDVMELSIQHMERCVAGHHYTNESFLTREAISKLNQRFREHGVGYQYESGQIIRIDSQLLHTEVVRPALQMLSASTYEGANEEFLSAHAHYRKGRYKECLNDSLNAFESCLKAICKKRGWAYTEKDTARRLIAIVFDEGLIPDFMQSHFSALRSVLESGVPTVRNRLGGHGQGPEKIIVPEYIAVYALHLTASNIVLLARAERSYR